jgi:hypothetical protein
VVRALTTRFIILDVREAEREVAHTPETISPPANGALSLKSARLPNGDGCSGRPQPGLVSRVAKHSDAGNDEPMPAPCRKPAIDAANIDTGAVPIRID